jgi:uroporphyrinogen decarboxylase
MMMKFSDITDVVRSDKPRVIGPLLVGFFPNFVGGVKEEIDARQYYSDPEVKFQIQYQLRRNFPEASFWPGMFHDFGSITEATAFGGRILWSKDNGPVVLPAIESLASVDGLTTPQPGTTGLTTIALVHREKMRRLLKEKGEEMEQSILTMGPGDLAGQVVGYDKFFEGIYLDPARLKQLLEICTDFIIQWIKTQAGAYGGADVITLADHTLSQISPDSTKEFIMPYFQTVTSEFPASVKIYHNEGLHRDNHLKLVPDLGCDIWHYGTQEYNLPDLLAKLSPKVVLFGGIGPNGAMRNGGPENVRDEVREAFSHTKGHRFIFGHGTGTTPDTSYENHRAMVEETVKCLQES